MTFWHPEEVALGRGGGQHPLEPVLHECKRYHGDIFVALDEVEGPAKRHLVDAIVDLRPNRLGDSFRETLFEQTSGHPLFTIELLRDMQEAGDLTQDPEGRWITCPDMDWEAVPARVEGVIEKRIGRLEPALHEMLTVAGVEGEEFTAQIVAQVQEIEERQALGALSRELASRHRLVRELGEEAVSAQLVSHYRFTHALFQHYLYEQLGGGERRLLHREIAYALEDLYKGQTERIAVQLARHFQEDGVAEKATVYHLAAGQQALEVSAPDEAIAHFREGLGLSRALDEPDARAKLQLQLQIGLGSALIPIKGYCAPEVEESFSQAQELCRQLGASAELWPVLWGHFYYHLVRGEHSAARNLGELLLVRLSRIPDDTPLIVVHHTLGTSSYFLGEFDLAIEHLGQGVRLYDAERHHPQALKYGRTDTGAACLSLLALALFTAGFPRQALERSRANLDLVRELSHPWSTATAHVFTALLHQTRGRAADPGERAGGQLAIRRVWLSLLDSGRRGDARLGSLRARLERRRDRANPAGPRRLPERRSRGVEAAVSRRARRRSRQNGTGRGRTRRSARGARHGVENRRASL